MFIAECLHQRMFYPYSQVNDNSMSPSEFQEYRRTSTRFKYGIVILSENLHDEKSAA